MLRKQNSLPVYTFIITFILAFKLGMHILSTEYMFKNLDFFLFAYERWK